VILGGSCVRSALLDLVGGTVDALVDLVGVVAGEVLGLVQRVIETHVHVLSFAEPPRARGDAANLTVMIP
jgi:hypothetical protein